MAKVNIQHKEYKRWIGVWKKCRAFADGEEAVKDEGIELLPPLSGHLDAAGLVRRGSGYYEYLADAYLYEATSRTIEGLSGLVFRRPPATEYPEALAEFIKDVTGSGLSFAGFAEYCIDEILKVGRGGVLVEHVDTIPLSRAEQVGLNPFLIFYTAESIINWRVERVNNQLKLTQVVLFEEEEVMSEEDEFVFRLEPQYRVLDLDENGFYRQRVFRRMSAAPIQQDADSSRYGLRPDDVKGDEWDEWERIEPLSDGNRIEHIPFTFLGPRDTGAKVQKPPLLGLVNANWAWYRTCADYRHGLRWAGHPTPILKGVIRKPGEEDMPIPIGSSQAIELGIDGDAKFLEFTGQGLKPLQEALKDLESIMAILGARMLAPEKRQVEAAETAAIHRHGENSSLGSTVGAVESGLNRIVRFVMDWIGVDGEFLAGLNRRFIPYQITPQLMSSVVKSWQAGAAIALPDIHWLWQEAEIVRSDRSYQEVMADIESEVPRPPTTVGELLDLPLQETEEPET